jgi:integrase
MSIYKRAGRWHVRVDLDPHPTGTRNRRSLGSFPSKKAALAAEREALIARDRGVDIAPARLTIAQLMERFFADREALDRAEKTVSEYRLLNRLYVAPHLGGKPVSKLKPAHIAEWTSFLLREGGQSSARLAAKTVNHAFRLLNAALRWGIRMELVLRNVCEAVTPPSVPKSAAKAFEVAEVGKLLAAAAGTRWEAYVTLALATGARRAELLALNWADVDEDTRSVTICRAMCQLVGRAPFAEVDEDQYDAEHSALGNRYGGAPSPAGVTGRRSTRVRAGVVS